jgi:hypothetical protein
LHESIQKILILWYIIIFIIEFCLKKALHKRDLSSENMIKFFKINNCTHVSVLLLILITELVIFATFSLHSYPVIVIIVIITTFIPNFCKKDPTIQRSVLLSALEILDSTAEERASTVLFINIKF